MALTCDSRKLELPDVRIREVGVQQAVSVLEMPYEESHDQADRREAFSTVEQYGDYVPDRSPLPEQFVAHSLQRL